MIILEDRCSNKLTSANELARTRLRGRRRTRAVIRIRRYQVRHLRQAIPVESFWNRLTESLHDADPLRATGDARSRSNWPPRGRPGRHGLLWAVLACQGRPPWGELRLPPKCRSRSTRGPHGPGIFARRQMEAADVDASAWAWNAVSNTVCSAISAWHKAFYQDRYRSSLAQQPEPGARWKLETTIQEQDNSKLTLRSHSKR